LNKIPRRLRLKIRKHASCLRPSHTP